MKKALIITAILGAAGAFAYTWMKRPPAAIRFNDKSGNADVELGSKRKSVSANQGVVLKTWNGYELSVDGGTGKYTLSRYGKMIESSSGITPYDGGSSYVRIDHT